MSTPNFKTLLKNRQPDILQKRDERGNIPTQMLGLRIPEEDHRELKMLAAQRGATMTQIVQTAIREYLDRNPLEN